MSDAPIHQIVTANDLFEGDVIYLTRAGGWTRDLKCAAIATTTRDAEALLEKAHQPLTVVGPYLIDVEIDDNGAPVPKRFREALRNVGPSVHYGPPQAAHRTADANHDLKTTGI